MRIVNRCDPCRTNAPCVGAQHLIHFDEEDLRKCNADDEEVLSSSSCLILLIWISERTELGRCSV